MVHWIGMKYGQLPRTIDSLPWHEFDEMRKAVEDLAEYEADALKPKDDIDVD